MPTCSVAGEAKVGDDFGPGLGLWSLCAQERVKDLILLFLFVCLFVFLLVCLSNSKSLQISYFSFFKALRNRSKKSWYFTRFMHFLGFFDMFNPLKRRPFPLNPRVAQHTAACRHCRRGPATCRAGSPEDWKKAQQAGSSFVFERKDQHIYIYIHIFFLHNKYTVYLEIYIYMYDFVYIYIHIHIYIYAFYTFFVKYTSCDMVYIYMMYLYILYYKQIPNNNGDSPENLDMKSQRPGMNLTFPTSVTANILNEKNTCSKILLPDMITLISFVWSCSVRRRRFICLISSLIKLIFQLPWSHDHTFSSGDHFQF